MSISFTDLYQNPRNGFCPERRRQAGRQVGHRHSKLFCRRHTGAPWWCALSVAQVTQAGGRVSQWPSDKRRESGHLTARRSALVHQQQTTQQHNNTTVRRVSGGQCGSVRVSVDSRALRAKHDELCVYIYIYVFNNTLIVIDELVYIQTTVMTRCRKIVCVCDATPMYYLHIHTPVLSYHISHTCTNIEREAGCPRCVNRRLTCAAGR